MSSESNSASYYRKNYVGILSRFIVFLAYALTNSGGYSATKKFFYNLLENHNYPYKRYFDIFMMILIFSSVFILIRDVRHTVNDFWKIFNDYIVSLIFLIEYVLRFWVVSDSSTIIIKQYEKDELLLRRFRLGRALMKIFIAKWNHVRSISAIIDLLAIMPFFHELRLFRMFILFRVFKLFRYTQNMQYFGRILSHKKFEFLTLLTFASVVIFVSSVLIYVMEANNPHSQINTLFDAFYWSVVTISTVGYGDVTPITQAGQSVAVLVIISGVAVLAFATSIVVTSFTEKLDEIRENKMVSDIRRLKKFYLICGYTDVAKQTASKLHRKGRKIVVLDTDPARVAEAKENKLYALAMDPASLSTYKTLGVDLAEQVEAVVLLRESDVLNVYTALTLRHIAQDTKLYSILHDKNNRRKLKVAGVHNIVYAQEIVGLLSKEYSGKPIAFETMALLRAEHSSTDMIEVAVDGVMAEQVKDVASLAVRKHRLILIGIQKKGAEHFTFKPSGDFSIVQGDILVLVGEISMLNEFKVHTHSHKRFL